MKKKAALSATAVAVLASTMPAYVAPVEAEEQGNTIYVKFDNGGTNNASGGDGSLDRPYNQLREAVNSASNGDTIIIIGKGTINDINSDSAPWYIDKNITITSTSDEPASVAVRSGGIILGADVTFKNIQLNFENKVHDAIFANGHTLNLINVVRYDGARQIDLFAGGLDTAEGTYVAGNNPTINVITDGGFKGKVGDKNYISEFGGIYAGSMNGDYDKSAKINVSNTGSTGILKVAGIFASGAWEADSGSMLDINEPALPQADSFNLPNYGNVEVTLENMNVPVNGETGTTSTTTLASSGRNLTTLNATTIENLDLEGTTFKVPSDIFDNGINQLTLGNNAILDLTDHEGDFEVSNYQGHGGVALPTSGTTMHIEQSFDNQNSLMVYLDGYTYNYNGRVTVGQTYVTTANSDAPVEYFTVNYLDEDYLYSPVQNGSRYEWKVLDPKNLPTNPDGPDVGDGPDENLPELPTITGFTISDENKNITKNVSEFNGPHLISIPFSLTTQEDLRNYYYLFLEDYEDLEVTVDGHEVVYTVDESDVSCFYVEDLNMYIYLQPTDEDDLSQQEITIEFKEDGTYVAPEAGTYNIGLSLGEHTLDTTLTVEGLEVEDTSIKEITVDGSDSRQEQEANFVDEHPVLDYDLKAVFEDDGTHVLDLASLPDTTVSVNDKQATRVEGKDYHFRIDEYNMNIRFEPSESDNYAKMYVEFKNAEGTPVIPQTIDYVMEVSVGDVTVFPNPKLLVNPSLPTITSFTHTIPATQRVEQKSFRNGTDVEYTFNYVTDDYVSSKYKLSEDEDLVIKVNGKEATRSSEGYFTVAREPICIYLEDGENQSVTMRIESTLSENEIGNFDIEVSLDEASLETRLEVAVPTLTDVSVASSVDKYPVRKVKEHQQGQSVFSIPIEVTTQEEGWEQVDLGKYDNVDVYIHGNKAPKFTNPDGTHYFDISSHNLRAEFVYDKEIDTHTLEFRVANGSTLSGADVVLDIYYEGESKFQSLLKVVGDVATFKPVELEPFGKLKREIVDNDRGEVSIPFNFNTEQQSPVDIDNERLTIRINGKEGTTDQFRTSHTFSDLGITADVEKVESEDNSHNLALHRIGQSMAPGLYKIEILEEYDNEVIAEFDFELLPDITNVTGEDTPVQVVVGDDTRNVVQVSFGVEVEGNYYPEELGWYDYDIAINGQSVVTERHDNGFFTLDLDGKEVAGHFVQEAEGTYNLSIDIPAPGEYPFEITIDGYTINRTLKVVGASEPPVVTEPTITKFTAEGLTTKTFDPSDFTSHDNPNTFFTFKTELTGESKELSSYEGFDLSINGERADRQSNDDDGGRIYYFNHDEMVHAYIEYDEVTCNHKLVLLTHNGEGEPTVPKNNKYTITLSHTGVEDLTFTANVEEDVVELKPTITNFTLIGDNGVRVPDTDGPSEGGLVNFTFNAEIEDGTVDSLANLEGFTLEYNGEEVQLEEDPKGDHAYLATGTTYIYIDNTDVPNQYKLRVEIVDKEGTTEAPPVGEVQTITLKYGEKELDLKYTILPSTDIGGGEPDPQPPKVTEVTFPEGTNSKTEETNGTLMNMSILINFNIKSDTNDFVSFKDLGYTLTINGDDAVYDEETNEYVVADKGLSISVPGTGVPGEFNLRLGQLGTNGVGYVALKPGVYNIEAKGSENFNVTFTLTTPPPTEPDTGGSTGDTSQPSTPPSTGGGTTTPEPTPEVEDKVNGVENFKDLDKDIQEKVDSLITSILTSQEGVTLNLEGDDDDLSNVSTLEVTADGIFAVVGDGKVKFNTELDLTDINWDNTRVLRVNDDGSYSPVMHGSNGDGLTIKTGDFSNLLITSKVSEPFSDVNDDDWFKEEVEELYNYGITTGTTATTYSPNESITRAQFAVMLARSFELIPATNTPSLSDIEGAWYQDEVQALYDAGIISGYADVTFGGENELTRQQATKMLYKVMEYKGADTTSTSPLKLKDLDKISAEYTPYVEFLASKNIINSGEDTSFNPMNNLTRAQMAKIVVRALNINYYK